MQVWVFYFHQHRILNTQCPSGFTSHVIDSADRSGFKPMSLCTQDLHICKCHRTTATRYIFSVTFLHCCQIRAKGVSSPVKVLSIVAYLLSERLNYMQNESFRGLMYVVSSTIEYKQSLVIDRIPLSKSRAITII